MSKYNCIWAMGFAVQVSNPDRGKIFFCIVYFLLGISPASNCSWPTFRNPVSVPSSKAGSAKYNVTPGKYPEENIQYSNHGESLKSRRFFSLPQNVQTGSGSHPASYWMGTGVFLWGNLLGRQVNHSSSYCAKVKRECSCTSAPPIHLQGLSRQNITFYLWICQ